VIPDHLRITDIGLVRSSLWPGREAVVEIRDGALNIRPIGESEKSVLALWSVIREIGEIRVGVVVAAGTRGARRWWTFATTP
jgi:hypothetical protein